MTAIVFKNREERLTFAKAVLIMNSDKRFKHDVYAWMGENLSSMPRFIYTRSHGDVLQFASNEDKIMFKLKWL